ncbi:hypothetical protein CCICO_05715 [Corynebacterium ciconiae DSM 44920]|uniref:hypothetical protein n=1 Tax=Corynebacterium ciconiae TaxID=227319 RepID=UPI00037235F2|nr:hypothetical protein [Corynebacterium ciconiae]WKD61171.1 hypothetical protein CCICO_05715 [Corynebacterium ciconiae DSM 44920]
MKTYRRHPSRPHHAGVAAVACACLIVTGCTNKAGDLDDTDQSHQANAETSTEGGGEASQLPEWFEATPEKFDHEAADFSLGSPCDQLSSEQLEELDLVPGRHIPQGLFEDMEPCSYYDSSDTSGIYLVSQDRHSLEELAARVTLISKENSSFDPKVHTFSLGDEVFAECGAGSYTDKGRLSVVYSSSLPVARNYEACEKAFNKLLQISHKLKGE